SCLPRCSHCIATPYTHLIVGWNPSHGAIEARVLHNEDLLDASLCPAANLIAWANWNVCSRSKDFPALHRCGNIGEYFPIFNFYSNFISHKPTEHLKNLQDLSTII